LDQGLLTKLAQASISKGYEPETEIDWSRVVPQDALVLPDWGLSLSGLPEMGKIPDGVRRALARHEVSSTFSMSIRFEETLIRNLGKHVQHADPEAPELSYLLHVIEEEARHNRMFIRLIEKMGVGGYPARGLLGFLQHRLLGIIRASGCFFYLGVFGVEEITDRIFAEWVQDAETDESVKAVCRIHRIEEARHRRFSLDALRSAYVAAGPLHKLATAVVAPFVVNAIFDVLVPPSVYVRSGLVKSRGASWWLWFRARQTPARLALRQRCAAPVLAALTSLGAAPRPMVPVWRLLGTPLDGSSAE
jgi:hypothetical protein